MSKVVFGVSGGIGSALARQLVARGETVHGFSRRETSPIAGVQHGLCDITDETALEAAAARLAEAGQPDMVIVATGILHDSASDLGPEKSLRHQSLSAFEQVFRANTFGPALVAKHFIPRLPRKGRGVFAALSARVGSISDNGFGGWHAYRASKAALNMLIRNYAIEQARRNPDFIAAGLHPGTVDTDLSQPFQANVPEGKLFTPDHAARCLLDVLDALSPDQSGQVFDYAGQRVPA